MAKFHSFEEIEIALKHEDIPKTDLDKSIIIDQIVNGKRKNNIKPQVILTAILLAIFIPIMSHGNISYSQMIKDITKSIYGKVVKYLDIREEDGGFQLVEYEDTEEERRRIEKYSEINKEKAYEEILNELKPGEAAILTYAELYDIGFRSITISKPIIFNNVEEIKGYGLDVSTPEYIPKGYIFYKAELDFIGKDYDELGESAAQLANKAKEEDIPYLWEKVEDIIEYELRVYYEPIGKRARSGYSTISVEINLTDYDAVNQRLVEQGTDYEVEILDIGEREVMRYTYGYDDIWEYYVFKIPNRKYKTYEIRHVKENPLPFEELEKMINSFE